MSGNLFGSQFKVMTFGESHGSALGAVIDGCPSGVDFYIELLKSDLVRRRPGQSGVVTQRDEADEPQVLSGVFEGKTLGTPICIVVQNKDQQSKDYSEIKKNPRIGHADDMWKNKYQHVDYRGGGRSSGRETVARVMAGSVAKMFLQKFFPKLKVNVWTAQIGEIQMSEEELVNLFQMQDLQPAIYSSDVRMPLADKSEQAKEMLLAAKAEGESFGGVAQVFIQNPPENLGEPVFKKVKSELASAFLSIGAANGFELGAGFKAAKTKGTEFHQNNQSLVYGGVRGGISTGEDIHCRVSFKPTSSVLDVAKKGRHDPCIVPRAVSVVEAMCWLVLADLYLMNRSSV